MMKFIKKLFKKQHPLYSALVKKDESEFCMIFMDSDIFVLDDDIGEGLPLDSPPEEILRQTEKQAKELADKAEFKVFGYEEGGKKYLPFFLTQKHADLFCGAYCGRENRLFAFQMLQIKGSEVIESLSLFDRVIMNDQSDEEYELTPGILSNLKNIKS